jgi:hypothetical protein
MKKVIIGFDKNGEPYVMRAPKKIEIEFKKRPDKKTLRKRVRTVAYQVKTFFGGAAS